MSKKPQKQLLPATSAERWREWIASDVRIAETMLIASGELLPMFVVHGADNSIHPIGAPFTNDAEKDHAIRIIRLLAIAYDAIAVSYYSEVWLREGDIRTMDESILPRNAEDRIEGVMFEVCYRDAAGERQWIFEMRETLRGPDGKPTELKHRYGSEESGMKRHSVGRFAELLPPTRPSPKEAAATRSMVETMFHKVETRQ